jgi:hypothetical protein
MKRGRFDAAHSFDATKGLRYSLTDTRFWDMKHDLHTVTSTYSSHVADNPRTANRRRDSLASATKDGISGERIPSPCDFDEQREGSCHISPFCRPEYPQPPRASGRDHRP